MRFGSLATALAIALSSGDLLAQTSPYAVQQAREIKALSAQEIDDLLNARGMALAYGSSSAPQAHDPAKRHGN